jgi:hypothetical protein
MSDRVVVRRPLLPKLTRRPGRVLGPLLLAALALLPSSASAAEITGFISGAQPSSSWGTGWGGMLTISLFTIVHLEIEGAHQSGSSELTDTSMLTIAGKAYFGPPIGRLVPYVGLGGGAYRESLPARTDDGTLGLVFAGAKLKFPFGLVIRGEYQWVSLPEAAPIKLDHRYFFALGLSL